MDGSFFKPREPSRSARGIFAAYAGLGLVLSVTVGWRLASGTDWLWAILAGIVAWGALQQGLTGVVEGWILSLEVGVYLFVFLVQGIWPAFLAVLVTSILSVIHGVVIDPKNRHVDFYLRKMANNFVLGMAFLLAAYAYLRSGGAQILHLMGWSEAGSLLLFWLVFTLVNNLLFWPVDVSREGAFHFPRLIKEMGIDSMVHAIGAFTGAGFAVLFNHVGIGPLLLLVPVYTLMVIFLKRITEQRRHLKLQHTLLRKLNEKAVQIHGSLDLSVVLDAVGDTVESLFGGEVFFVALFDERTGKVQVARAMDHGTPLAIEDFDPDQGLTGLVLRTGEPVFSGDVTQDERIRGTMKSYGDETDLVHSVMLGPLINKGRLIGVFSVQANSRDAFKPFHRDLFMAVLQQVSTAVVAARLYKRATEDGLTRLYNRSFLDERVEACLKESRPFGLVFIDCDNFKAINDAHGHTLGDRYLAALAREIGKRCRKEDVPSRYGGDEFAVLLPGATAAQARLVANRILTAVDEMYIHADGEKVGTTVSIGLLWSDGTTGPIPIEDVFQKVDVSLYEAKGTKHAIVETTLS